MAELSGKVALVTGGGRGIGRGISERLAADGALVAVHYGSNEGTAQETVAAIEADRGSAFAVGAPLEGDVSPLFEALDRELQNRVGATKLDILVNNAGASVPGTLAEITPDVFDQLFAVNGRAPLFIIQAAAERMPDGGRVINMSSAVTDLGLPHMLVYSLTKANLRVMSKILAKELAPRGITVNAVAPGLIDTEMVSDWIHASEESHAQAASYSMFNRVGEPSEVADVVAFLTSNEARWVTGECIYVGG